MVQEQGKQVTQGPQHQDKVMDQGKHATQDKMGSPQQDHGKQDETGSKQQTDMEMTDAVEHTEMAKTILHDREEAGDIRSFSSIFGRDKSDNMVAMNTITETPTETRKII